MKKALLVTTVSGFIPQFEMNNVKILQQMGYEVHYAANYDMPSYGKDNTRLDGTGVVRHQIDFVRSPFRLKNIEVYRQLKSLMKEDGFQLVHCHTPMGGVMARLAAHATGTHPVIYTAHGFHFYKGASWVNWLFYYPMERWLSRYTDQQICINREDYQAAQKFRASRVDYIPGVGINVEKIRRFADIDVMQKKKELNLPLNKIIILSAGELIKRKNHETVIRAMAQIKDNSAVYVICGHGELDEYLKNLTKKLQVEDKVIFMGYRSDIMEIYQIADLYIFPSYQEGLPMALLEAMACGLPVICSDIRGSRDLMGMSLADEKNVKWKWCDGGAMVKAADDVDAYASAVQEFLHDSVRIDACGKRNAGEAENFSLERVAGRMEEIYNRIG